MDLFKIEPGLMIWTWVSFLTLFVIMYKFVFPILLQNIRDREEKITRSVEDAENIRKTREEIDVERDEAVKNAKIEGNEILHRIREDADLLKKNLEKKAQSDADTILQQARDKAKEEKDDTMQQLKAKLAEFVCDASEKIIGRSFVTEEDQKWTRELAEQL
ncbi:MAG: F0F1 ATP synthase subunit B [Kiritimatiellia bacterium]